MKAIRLAENKTSEDLQLGSAYLGKISEKNGKKIFAATNFVSGELKGPEEFSTGNEVVAKLVSIEFNGSCKFEFLGKKEEFEVVEERKAQAGEESISSWKLGDEVKLVARVSCSFQSVFFVCDGTGFASASGFEAEEGQLLELEGIVSERGSEFGKSMHLMVSSGKEVFDGNRDKEIEYWIKEKAKANGHAVFQGLEDLVPLLGECAGVLKKALMEFKPIIIKYHSDPDGICAALNLYEPLREFAKSIGFPLQMHFVTGFREDSAIYSENEAFSDREFSKQFPKQALLVITDRGANEESLKALVEARSAGMSVLIIDHHPPAEGISFNCDLFVSPFAVGVKSGDFTAGLLCFEVGKRIFPSAASWELAQMALHGDKSKFAGDDKKIARKTLGLDFFEGENHEATLADFERFVSDESNLENAATQADYRLERVIKTHVAFTKVKEVNGATLVSVKVDKLSRKGEFPSRAKVSNVVHLHYAVKEKPCVTLGLGEDSISIRANAMALQKGFSSNTLVKAIKEELPHAVISAGGHDAASAIRFLKEFDSSVCQATAKKAEELLQGK